MRLLLFLLVCVAFEEAQGRRLRRSLPPCTTTAPSTNSFIHEFLMPEDTYAALNRSGRPAMTTSTGEHSCLAAQPTQTPKLPDWGLCPWQLVSDYDANRYPPVIQKAQCQCNSCRDPTDGAVNDVYTCQPLSYPMQVLKLVNSTSSNGYVKWKFEEISVTVGCACLVTASIS
ncbi:Interleukin 17-like protein [Holothuria leucospilota]|uniref:Interleukin 17-like protein n=1 Tax=Holothuria leucospilota TaxID=206669 RepID=A0A9Q1C8P9_HOLLE|nr:Interleukin 17-like protein [Holothuria leucospilota]